MHTPPIEELEDYALPKPLQSRLAKRVAIFAVALICVVGYRYLGGPRGALARSGWINNWDEAITRTQETGKPALVLFTADWCPACHEFEEKTLANAKAQQYLREHYTLVVVDLTDQNGPGVKRAEEFGVKAIPMIIAYDDKNQEVARAHGMPPESLIAWLRAGADAK